MVVGYVCVAHERRSTTPLPQAKKSSKAAAKGAKKAAATGTKKKKVGWGVGCGVNVRVGLRTGRWCSLIWHYLT